MLPKVTLVYQIKKCSHSSMELEHGPSKAGVVGSSPTGSTSRNVQQFDINLQNIFNY